MARLLEVEVVYAGIERQSLISLIIEEGVSVEQAIKQSGILTQYPEIDLNVNKVGIFSKKVELYSKLKAGDRIEIYRSLLMDPKQARILRVRQEAGLARAK